jgi:hypothetical protein
MLPTITNIAELVRNQVSITDAVERRIPLRRKGRQAEGICPFHNDHRMGSFLVTEHKGIFKCFACGKGGDVIKFVSLYEHKTYGEAALYLAVEFGILKETDVQQNFRRRIGKSESFCLEQKFQEIDKVRLKPTPLATIEIRDELYRLFMKMAGLHPTQRDQLITQRGFDEQDIVDGSYFTFPTTRIHDFFSEVMAQYPQLDVLRGVPGFYFDKKTNQWDHAKYVGIGFPIRNEKNQIVAIQVRKEDKSGSRYIWFSSSFAEQSTKEAEGGSSPGSPIDVWVPKQVKNTTLFITEGRFKAQWIGKVLSSIALSVQGVGSWRNVLESIPSITANYGTKDIIIAFDADIDTNYNVFKHAQKLSDALDKEGYQVFYLYWNKADGKGMDDVLISGNVNAFRRVPKAVFDIVYEERMEQVMISEGITRLEQLKAEQLEKYPLVIPA